jgi:hypothetical protein
MHFKKGVSALISMIALGAIIILVTGTAILVENNRTVNYVSDTNGSQITAAAESILQDALLKLNLKTGVTNYSLTINGITVGVCYYADSPSAGLYIIETKAVKGNMTRAIKALVNKDSNTSKFSIYSKEEDLNSTCTITAATVPGAPQNLLWFSSSDKQITIKWSAPLSNGFSNITGYKIYRGTSSGGEVYLATAGNVFTYTDSDTSLVNNTSYYYKVTAVNAIGEGPLSAEVLAIPGQTPTGTITVSNYASGNYVGATYQITGTFTSSNTVSSCDYTTNGGTNWYSANVSSPPSPYTCLKTGVAATDGTSYNINMRMTNNIGTNTATVISETGDVTGPTVTDNWTDSWTATSPVSVTLTPTDNNKSGVATTKYCTDSTGTCNPSSGTVGLSTSFTCGSNLNCTNYIDYASWDNVNNASSIYSKRVRQDKLAPTDGTLTVTPGVAQNTLSWTIASDTGSGLAASNTYNVVFLTTGLPNATCSNGSQIYLGSNTTFSPHTGLTAGTTYYYRVCAYDIVGNVSNGVTGSGVPTQANGTVCTSGSQCASGNCYVDADGDRYAPSSGTKTCNANTQIAGVDCNDSCATCWPGNSACYTTADSKDNDCNGSIDDTTSQQGCGTTPLSCTMCSNSVSCGGTGATCGSYTEGCGECASQCGGSYSCSGTTCKQSYFNTTSTTCYH